MFWVSNFLGTDVVSLDNAKKLGAVEGFCFNNQKNCLLARTSQGCFFLTGIFSKNHVLTVESAEQISPTTGELLNTGIFDTTGTKLADLKDIFVDRQCQIKKLSTHQDHMIPPSKIFRIGDVILLKGRLPKTLQTKPTAKKPSAKKSPPFAVEVEVVENAETKGEGVEENSEEFPVAEIAENTTLSAEKINQLIEEKSVSETVEKSVETANAVEATEVAESKPVEQQKPELPKILPKKHGEIPKRYGDFTFLIGRTCYKNITNFQGEVMIKRNSLITKDTLRQAKLNGKLIELALNC